MEVTIEVKTRPFKFQELYQTLHALLPAIRKQQGCLDCRIYRDTEDADIFFLSVRWEEGVCFEEYLRSNDGSALLGAIEVLSEKSRVKIGSDQMWNSINMLQKMRKKGTQ